MIIGAQMYTLREFCKTTQDLETSLARVAEMGYTAVQLSGVCGYDPAWMRDTLKKLGLVAPVTHVAAEKLRNDLPAVIAAHDVTGIPYIGLGSAPHCFDKEKNALLAFDEALTWLPQTAKAIAAAGHRFLYHNHNREYAKNAEGKNFFERLAEVLTPAECGFLADTYWCQMGGDDPAAFLLRYRDRVPCIHFKDFAFDPAEHAPHMAPVGEGNLNWERIFAAAKEAGVEYAFVEQDKCYGEDPFDCLKRSLAFCRSAGL